MSAGREAAQETKGVLKGIQNAGEEARKNVNSFADELIGGNKTHQSTGFSKDAQIVGDEIGRSVNNANTGGGHHTAHTTPHTTTHGNTTQTIPRTAPHTTNHTTPHTTAQETRR